MGLDFLQQIVMFRISTLFHRFSHTIEPMIESYYSTRVQQFEKYSKMEGQPYVGAYTEKGSKEWEQKHAKYQAKSLISHPEMRVSGIGVGSYRGSLNADDDILQFNAIIDSVLLGANVIDTCRNFRGGRSEQVIQAALRYLIEERGYSRDQLLIMSKCGYVRDSIPQDLQSQVINGHCVHPTYLQQSLQKSLQSLNLSTLDVFYLNNFAQCQIRELGQEKFEHKLCKSFQFMEKCVKEKKIQFYGIASFHSLRMGPDNVNHLNLASVVKLAEKVGGRSHSFRFIQVPINIMMPEAFAQKSQQSGSLLETADEYKINVISCSPLLSGTLINTPLPSNKLNCRNNGAKHLQIIRSIPSQALCSTLIGQKTARHVKKNLEVLSSPPLTQEQWFEFFVPKSSPHDIGAEDQLVYER